MRRSLLALAVAAMLSAAALAAPATASADSVGVSVYWEAVLGPSNTIIVDYQCQVGALPTAASVSIRCGIKKFGGGAGPGQIWLHTDGETIPVAPFSICWTGTATFLHGGTLSTSGCSPSQISAFGNDGSYTQG
jgi:hypothetical protein